MSSVKTSVIRCPKCKKSLPVKKIFNGKDFVPYEPQHCECGYIEFCNYKARPGFCEPCRNQKLCNPENKTE